MRGMTHFCSVSQLRSSTDLLMGSGTGTVFRAIQHEMNPFLFTFRRLSTDSTHFRNYSSVTIRVLLEVTATLPFVAAYVALGQQELETQPLRRSAKGLLEFLLWQLEIPIQSLPG